MIIQEVLIRAIQLLLSLSLIAVVHGLGHFTFARLFKTRVEKFYLFFAPWFYLFRKKNGNTEYGIGRLPSGGDVKLSGSMIERKDDERISPPTQSWEFGSKPAWQRLVIMMGGIILNLILGFFIYTMIFWHTKESYLPTKNLTYGIAVDSLAESIGLRDGDMILSVNNAPVENFRAIPAEIILREATSIQVERDGKPIDIAIPAGFLRDMIRSRSTLINVRVPFEVDEVVPNSAAQRGGFQKGDQVLTINGTPTYYFHEFKKTYQLYKNTTVPIEILRNRDTLQLTIQIPETGILGITGCNNEKFLKFATSGHTFLEALPAGLKKCTTTLGKYSQQFWIIFTPTSGNSVESLGGFISITSLFPAQWDWLAFWDLTALLSIILAFVNMLPIPPLDGGYILFLLYEIVARRKPAEKSMKYACVAGTVVICSLIFYSIWT